MKSMAEQRRHQELLKQRKLTLLCELEAEYGCLTTQVTRARDRYEQGIDDPQEAEARVRRVLGALQKVVAFLEK